MYHIQRKSSEEIIKKLQGFELEALKKLVFRIKKKLTFNDIHNEPSSRELENHDNETPILGKR